MTPITVIVTAEEIARCKRAVVVLSEVFKTALGGKSAPLGVAIDVRTLISVLRRLEPLATPGPAPVAGGQPKGQPE